MTGTISLTSSESDAPTVETPAVQETPVVVADVDEHEADAVEDEAAVDEVDDDGANDAAADGDLAAVPVPTSVDEAAQTHEFDEACGNHGAYVSQFAQTGTEPDCAVQARAGTAATPEATDVAASSADDSAHENHGNGKSASASTDKADHASKGGKSAKSAKSKSGR
jgi:hypothetical protein